MHKAWSTIPHATGDCSKGQDTPSLLAHQQLHLCQEPPRNSGGSFQRYKPSLPNKDSRPLFIAPGVDEARLPLTTLSEFPESPLSSFVSQFRSTTKEDHLHSSIQAQLSTERAPPPSQRCLVNQRPAGALAAGFLLSHWQGGLDLSPSARIERALLYRARSESTGDEPACPAILLKM